MAAVKQVDVVLRCVLDNGRSKQYPGEIVSMTEARAKRLARRGLVAVLAAEAPAEPAVKRGRKPKADKVAASSAESSLGGDPAGAPVQQPEQGVSEGTLDDGVGEIDNDPSAYED